MIIHTGLAFNTTQYTANIQCVSGNNVLSLHETQPKAGNVMRIGIKYRYQYKRANKTKINQVSSTAFHTTYFLVLAVECQSPHPTLLSAHSVNKKNLITKKSNIRKRGAAVYRKESQDPAESYETQRSYHLSDLHSSSFPDPIWLFLTPHINRINTTSLEKQPTKSDYN